MDELAARESAACAENNCRFDVANSQTGDCARYPIWFVMPDLLKNLELLLNHAAPELDNGIRRVERLRAGFHTVEDRVAAPHADLAV